MRRLVCCNLFLSMLLAAAASASDRSAAVTSDMLKPKGVYYQATVPDTLDLAEPRRAGGPWADLLPECEGPLCPLGSFFRG